MRELSRPILMVFAAAALVACGKKEVPAPAAPPSAPAPQTARPAPEPLRLAWVYAGTVADAGMTFAYDRGRQAVASELGTRVETSTVERVHAGVSAERALRDLAARNNTLVLATDPAYAPAVRVVAAEFPNVKFEINSDAPMPAQNVRSYGIRLYEAAYLAGVVAGLMTKTSTLGYVGSVATPAVLRNINAFTLGAQSVNAKVKTKVVWVDTWFDPAKEGAAAQRLLANGADVLLQSTHSAAVLQAAEGAGKYAFGWGGDMSRFAPRAQLASCVVDWGHLFKKAARDVDAGAWKSGHTDLGMSEGVLDIGVLNAALPTDARQRLERLGGELRSGRFAVFSGPLVDSAGRTRLAAGATADAKWLAGVDFYVKGVEGKVPSKH